MELPTIGAKQLRASLSNADHALLQHSKQAGRAIALRDIGFEDSVRKCGEWSRYWYSRYLAYSRREAKRNEARKWADN